MPLRLGRLRRQATALAGRAQAHELRTGAPAPICAFGPAGPTDLPGPTDPAGPTDLPGPTGSAGPTDPAGPTGAPSQVARTVWPSGSGQALEHQTWAGRHAPGQVWAPCPATWSGAPGAERHGQIGAEPSRSWLLTSVAGDRDGVGHRTSASFWFLLAAGRGRRTRDRLVGQADPPGPCRRNHPQLARRGGELFG